ncbi:hypothetical protein DJ568_06010 [Mucilaginibacter hurinus]|uniref:Uncharacterized protein n=1 Tax=Mucilaginibacter hurinus TaxID=2201324 RepID=A0A367GPR5_9SPHI|nr:hypothetical protein [Mucilaginibacter hurinus]RCH55447.1 hypothetical protein DJ568_06010 [Mucilaginibacter hurinus]
MPHTFHIPVLGLGFSIDTPLKVARYGITSTVSIVDDELTERMRRYHSEQNSLPYIPINKQDPDARARRITAYLNLLNDLVNKQFAELTQQSIGQGNDIDKYFGLLPDGSPLKNQYLDLLVCSPAERIIAEHNLRRQMRPGCIDVNIMSKVDKINYNREGDSTGDENTDALAALRGFAISNLQSSVILSAGMNPRLYSYLEAFPDFSPDSNGIVRKQVILKVSDFRSALIQAKFLAKKGIWVHEFRIESGLNCGGHAFATEGLLLGPILEEFKQKRQEMVTELHQMYTTALEGRGYSFIVKQPQRVSVQGGIGTAHEHDFLIQNYNLDGAGWGSPFLLVPEATNVDDATLKCIATADTSDFYVSAASPLGVPFNNFKKSTAEQQRAERVERGRPGSPCTKKYLCSNTEFTQEPICTASREYQHLKIDQLKHAGLIEELIEQQIAAVTEKICLCEGLCASAYIKYDMLKPKENKAVAICPGPNLAYFSGTYTLEEMVKHIYGRLNLLAGVSRPNLFINELNLYIDHLKKDISLHLTSFDTKKEKYINKFKTQLYEGIAYYNQLIPQIPNQTREYLSQMQAHLIACEFRLNTL